MIEQRAESIEHISLWERVVLTLQREGQRADFLTRIEDIRKDCFRLEMPIRQNGSLHLQKGDVVDVTFNRKDASYSFKASILDLFEGETKSMNIQKITDTDRVQRRKYVRLDISGEMTYKVVETSTSGDEGLSSEKDGTILNLSAGGVLFEVAKKIKVDSILIVGFVLKENQALNNILAIVKRCEGSKADGYLVGAEFLTKNNIAQYGLNKLQDFLPPGSGTFDENLQKLIVQFIYDQQVELRKKGLLF